MALEFVCGFEMARSKNKERYFKPVDGELAGTEQGVVEGPVCSARDTVVRTESADGMLRMMLWELLLRRKEL